MSEINTKICRICVKNSNDDDISDATSYIGSLTKILGIKTGQRKIWLCIWCRAALKRTKELWDLAAESEQIFAKDTLLNVYTINKSQKYPYRLSFHHNIHVDIPPIKDAEINIEKENVEVRNGIKNYADDVCDAKNDIEESDTNPSQELEMPLKRRKLSNNYNEMKFQVKFLSFEEQTNEIEDKRKRDKYKNMKFQCNYCGIEFLTEDVFLEHNRRHSESAGAHKCQICHLRFKTPDVWSQHMLAHKRRFTCLICRAMFKRWSHCIAHRYKCGTVGAPATCGLCLKMYSNDHSLDIHIKGVHRTEKKYACLRCEKRFASKQRLTIHTRSHTGQKPFACEQCSRRFATNSNLRAHSSVHADVKQHYCVECNTYYKTEKSLKRHFSESARHLNIKEMTYPCMDCSKQFATEKLLKYHINIRHLSTYRCNICKKTFSNKTNLNKHVRCIHAPP